MQGNKFIIFLFKYYIKEYCYKFFGSKTKLEQVIMKWCLLLQKNSAKTIIAIAASFEKQNYTLYVIMEMDLTSTCDSIVWDGSIRTCYYVDSSLRDYKLILKQKDLIHNIKYKLPQHISHTQFLGYYLCLPAVRGSKLSQDVCLQIHDS